MASYFNHSFYARFLGHDLKNFSPFSTYPRNIVALYYFPSHSTRRLFPIDEWISKKDLLAETGISYGQLYRWKREGLIPESWFVKRSVPSGQETFLPREMILNRVAFILKYKGNHPLNELHQMLSPDSESRHYKTTALIRLPGMLRPIMQISDRFHRVRPPASRSAPGG